MKHRILATMICLCVALAGSAFGLDERYPDEYSCLPVHGYIQLPGVKYDDLTPLARSVFGDNPAAVSNALYSLPLDKRDEFARLYLEPSAREKHRTFFIRCREVADRQPLEATLLVDGIIPPALRQELLDRDARRRSLHNDALVFRIAGRTVYIPAPEGFAAEGAADGELIRRSGLVGSHAVFGRVYPSPTFPNEESAAGRTILANVAHIRESGDSLDSMLGAYRTLVDGDWRITAVYPSDAAASQAETVNYQWNLRPFHIRPHSFAYGQFEKSATLHGVTRVHYQATAVILLPGIYIQVGMQHPFDTNLDLVNEINTSLAAWQNAILAANWD